MKITLQILLLVFDFGFLVDALTSKEEARRMHSFTAAIVLTALIIISITRL